MQFASLSVHSTILLEMKNLISIRSQLYSKVLYLIQPIDTDPRASTYSTAWLPDPYQWSVLLQLFHWSVGGNLRARINVKDENSIPSLITGHWLLYYSVIDGEGEIILLIVVREEEET